MNEKEILSRLSERLGISKLNDMQTAMNIRSKEGGDVVLLSPTGTGKTIAYLLPLLQAVKPGKESLQCVIIAPSRELVLQIYGVARELASGMKVACCYGGHNVKDEKNSLSATPTILVGTPGRTLDHINRNHIDVSTVRIVVLDEFDKSLELGFQDEMRRIIGKMPRLSRRFLTSATMIDNFPDFLRLSTPLVLNFLSVKKNLDRRISVMEVKSDNKDKLKAALTLIGNIGEGKTILFVNYRESAERVYDFLHNNGLSVTMYHGGLEQQDREKAITLFNNGTYKVLVATDLGSRGLDIVEVENIIHYHQPLTKEVYIHRNGRTARVNATGSVYVILGPDEKCADYMKFDSEKILDENEINFPKREFVSLYFNAGKKEKISKGDIVGFLINNSSVDANSIGRIDVFDHYSIAAIKASFEDEILSQLEGKKIKNKRLRITLVN